MSAEAIIKRIKTDSEQKAQFIHQKAERKAEEIRKNATKEAQQKAEALIEKGKQQAENRKKILISQVRQETKRAEINAKNNVIEDCFNQAMQQLSSLDESTYNQLVEKLIQQGKKRIDGPCEILISNEKDKQIAKKLHLAVSGSINATGGVILRSKDGTITIDNTFEGIIQREKEHIREKVGKLLFK